MTIKSYITDPATGRQAQVFIRNGDKGLKVFTQELHEKSVFFIPASNPAHGTEMAINASFSGSPALIHDGTDTTAWTGSSITGVKFTFDSTAESHGGTKSVETNNGSAGNVMEFAEGSYVDLSDFAGLSMFIYVSSNWASNSDDSMTLYGWDASQVGNSIRLEDYFNETEFGQWQKISIPFSDMNLTGELIYAFRIQVAAKSGTGPVWYLDDFQLEQSGGGAEFTTEAPKGTKFFIRKMRFTAIDAYDASLVNNSMPNLSYNKILGESALENGFSFLRTRDGIPIFSATIRTLGDGIKLGGDITNLISDGTNTCIALEIVLDPPILLDSRDSDKISVIINDDMTGLISFTALAFGHTEEIVT